MGPGGNTELVQPVKASSCRPRRGRRSLRQRDEAPAQDKLSVVSALSPIAAGSAVRLEHPLKLSLDERTELADRVRQRGGFVQYPKSTDVQRASLPDHGRQRGGLAQLPGRASSAPRCDHVAARRGRATSRSSVLSAPSSPMAAGSAACSRKLARSARRQRL